MYMNKKYQNIFIKFFYISLSIILICGGGVARASTLQIKNDDTAKVDITIEAGDGNVLVTDKNAINISLWKGEQRTIEVKKDRLNKDTFSVTGTVKMPSLYNKCGPLFIDKNYKIIFTGAKTGGTICIVEPME